MDKENFLRLQYVRMMNSEDFVVEQWRSSVGRFLADMYDRTPSRPGKRFLEPIDANLGFSPDNVEWQFKKIVATKTKAAPVRQLVQIKKRPTKAGRNAVKLTEAVAARGAKRQAIAAELAAWNNGDLAVRPG